MFTVILESQIWENCPVKAPQISVLLSENKRPSVNVGHTCKVNLLAISLTSMIWCYMFTFTFQLPMTDKKKT